MTPAEIMLVCAISGVAAALGWLAARLTLDSSADGFAFGLLRKLDRSKEGAQLTITVSPQDEIPANKFFIAVLKIPSMHQLLLNTNCTVVESELANYARVVNSRRPQLSVCRIALDSIECQFGAKDEDEAFDLLHDALEILGESAGGSLENDALSPRAAVQSVASLPAAQSAFDHLKEALEDPKLQSKTLVSIDQDAQSTGLASSHDVMNELRKALNSDEISLHYQPKLDVTKQAFRSAEALFRWSSKRRNQRSVGELIMLAEQHGVIRDLTLWSLRRAVEDQLQMIENGLDITTFVNLSGTLISDSEFTLEAIDILKHTRGKIGVEITETSVIEDASLALANLEFISAAGIEIAIDDYGTGLSSLRYLKRIPAQELKIDREFVKDLTNSHRDPMIVRSTIDLAHALGLRVTAEGVDDPTKAALLKVMGCDQLQGFHIARPMPLTQMIQFIRESSDAASLTGSPASLLAQTGSSSRK